MDFCKFCNKNKKFYELITIPVLFKKIIEFAKQENVSLDQTVAIGDGANDLEMIKTAGLGIAFNAKPKVAASANTTLNTADLSAVLLLMGIYI